jgi:O-antigen/teichoic acid export membrane protein
MPLSRIPESFDRKLFFLFFGRMIQVVFAVAGIRLMTELIGQQEIGHQYLIFSCIVWFNLVLINPLAMFVNRHLHEWKARGELYIFISQINRYFFCAALISVPVLIVTQYFAKTSFDLAEPSILLLVAGYIYFSTWFVTLNSFFNLFEVQRVFIFLNVISQFCGLVFATFFVTYFTPSALFWLAGLLAGQFVALVIAIFLFYRRFPKDQDARSSVAQGIFTKETLVFCYPIAIATFFMWFSNQGYRIVVERMLGAEYLAGLGVGLGLSISIAGVVETITTQYFYPKYYSKLPNSTLEERKAAWQELFRRTMPVYVPAAFLIAAVSPLVIRVLTAPNFRSVGIFVFFGAAIEFFRQMSNIAYLAPHGEKKTHHTIIPYGMGALVLGLAFWTFAHFFELNATTILISLLLGGIVTYIVALMIVVRLLKVKLDFVIGIKCAIFSLPLLLPAAFLSVNSTLPVLFVVSALSTAWFFAVVIYFIKNREAF